VVSTANPHAKRWQAAVEVVARRVAAERGKQTGPLTVVVDFTFPTKVASRHGQPHTFRPDTDNLAKLVLDCVMRAGLIADDSAVSCVVARKTWGNASQAGASVSIGPDRRVVLPPDPGRPDWL
jgi:Holliday junction resolvase RusA-like endonuclease